MRHAVGVQSSEVHDEWFGTQGFQFGGAELPMVEIRLESAELRQTEGTDHGFKTASAADCEYLAVFQDLARNLQADPFTVPTNDQSAITAIVRDINGNLVKNQTVSFVLTDSTNGRRGV